MKRTFCKVKYKIGDVIEYEVDPVEKLKILKLVFSIRGNKYHYVSLGYTTPGEEPFFWDPAESHDFGAIGDFGEVAGKIEIEAYPKLKHNIIQGLFIP